MFVIKTVSIVQQCTVLFSYKNTAEHGGQQAVRRNTRTGSEKRTRKGDTQCWNGLKVSSLTATPRKSTSKFHRKSAKTLFLRLISTQRENPAYNRRYCVMLNKKRKAPAEHKLCSVLNRISEKLIRIILDW